MIYSLQVVELVELLLDPEVARREEGGQLGHLDGRADPVLVQDGSAAHEPDRLLVGQDNLKVQA